MKNLEIEIKVRGWSGDTINMPDIIIGIHSYQTDEGCVMLKIKDKQYVVVADELIEAVKRASK